MANKKISQLTPKGSALAGTDLLEVSVYNGVTYDTKSLTGANVVSGLQPTLVSGTSIKTINSTTLLGSGDIVISTGLTVGTTPITSGTIGRILFEGTGNVLQQDSTLFWDNTNKRLGVGATPSTAVRLDVRAQGALSTDLAFRVRNSADTGNIIDVRGNSTINFFPTVTNPVFNINSNVNPTVNFYDANGLGALIAHRYQTNPANASNLMSQSINFASYGVSGGSYGGAKINHFINTYNWGNTYDAQKEGGYSLYFDSTNNFEGVVNSKKALWISPDKRQFIYNKTGDVITAQTDAFCFYSDDITAGNAAPHFITENGNVIKIYRETTAVAAAAFVANTSLIANDSATFGGYTMGQVVAALKAQGLLA